MSFNRFALGLTTLGASLMVSTLGASSAQAVGFVGDYAPGNWTARNATSTNGFADTTNAPTSISITGGNSGTGQNGQFSYLTTAQNSGQVSFNWAYFTRDTGGDSTRDLPGRQPAFYDRFGFLLNGAFTLLSRNNGPISQSGSSSFEVNRGDVFGFAIRSTDNRFGAATVTISNLNAPQTPQAVPEPASMLGLATVVGAGALSLKKQKSQALASTQERAKAKA